MRNLIRNILIFLLFILAVYQVMTLWFDSVYIYPFSSSETSRKVSDIEGMDYIMDKLIVSVGDNNIVGKANDIYSSENKKLFDDGIVETVNKGDKIDIGEFSWNNILKNRAIIYEYNCAFKGRNIPEIFGKPADESKAEGIDDFDCVIIMPDPNGLSMTVVFYNSNNNNYSALSLKNSAVIAQVYSASTAFASGESSDYISSVQNGFDIFSKNVFIPGWSENSLNYPLVNRLGMYKDESTAEKNAEDFFDNPVAKWSSSENNTLTYSDENTVVKFYKETKVFEYSNYRAEGSGSSEFSKNYITAVNTIRQDSFISNEICLDSYNNENGRYTFKFNYKINDRDLVPSDELKSKTGMSSFIEVSTEGGRLVKYKKYAYYFERSNTESIADCDFVTAVDKVYSDGKISSINLCYIADDRSAIKLNWIIEIDQNKFVVPAERE